MTMHSPLLPDGNECIDPVLLNRLLRPITQPGVLSSAIAKRIVAWVDYFSGRLPLFEELAKKRGEGGRLRVRDLPLVHARWIVKRADDAPTPSKVPATFQTVAPVVSKVSAHADVSATFQTAAAGPPKVPGTFQTAAPAAPQVPGTFLTGAPLPSKVPATLQNAPPIPGKAMPTFADAPPMQGRAMPTFADAPPIQGRAMPTFAEAPPIPSIGIAHHLGVTSVTGSVSTQLPIVTPLTSPQPRGVPVPTVSLRSALLDASRPVVRVIPRTYATTQPVVELPHVGRPAARVPVSASASNEPPMERIVRTVPASVATSESAVVRQVVPTRVEPKADVDVDTLVDKVERKLLRRMAAERDRRGGFG